MNRMAALALSPCLLALGLAVAACGGASSEATTGSKPPEKSRLAPITTASAATTDAKPNPSGAAAADSAKPSEGATGAEIAAKKSPFQLAAMTDWEMILRPAGDELYVTGSHFVAKLTTDGLKPVVTKEKDDAKWEEWGLPAYGRISNLGGGQGDAPLLIFLTDNGRVGFHLIFQRRGAAWKKIETTDDGRVYLGMSPWKDGRTLSLLRGISFQVVYSNPRFKLLSGPPAAMPEITKGEGPCPFKVTPDAQTAFPSGEVFMAGPACSFRSPYGSPQAFLQDKILVERWAAGQKKSVIDELPLAEGDYVKGIDNDHVEWPIFAGASPSDLYMTLGTMTKAPTLLHFDGKAWTRVDGPSKTAFISAMVVGSRGVLYAIAGSDVYSMEPGKSWELAPLPRVGDEQKPYDMAARSNGTVWLSVATKTGGALLTTGVAPARVDAVTGGKSAGDAYVLPPAASPSCTTNFAMLYAFTKVTPPDYDFPLTRKAVKGKKQFKGARFVVIEENKRKYFGAILPDYTTGKALIAEVEKEVKGSKPALLCHEPKVVRELKLNIETGEVEK